MEIARLLLLTFAKKILGGLLLISVFTVTLPKESNINSKANKDEVGKRVLLEANNIMHEGINQYVDVLAWDGSSYITTIQLTYHKNSNGTYNVNKPEFLMVQKYSGITVVVPSLNIVNWNNDKVKYTCNALSDSSHPGLVTLKFRQEVNNENINGDNNYMNFDGPMGIKWKAFVDSSYTQINDTCVLLKFRLAKA